jgi:hypothetical protein
MNETELRLECLKMALVTSNDESWSKEFKTPADVVKWALRYYEFIALTKHRGYDA